MKLCSLDIRRLLQPQSDHTNGRHILIHPVCGQLKWLPLSRQPDPAGLASTQRPPILATAPPGLDQVSKPHGHIANNRIRQEVPIVNDLDCDYGRFLIKAQELCGRLPHGVVRVPGGVRSMGWRGLVTQVDFDEWVETA